MTDIPATPGDIILDFLERLPVTIKSNVLHLCWYGMGNDDLVSLMNDNILGELREVLDEPSITASYACARLLGVLELILEPSEHDTEKLNWALYDETGEEFFRKTALRRPLERRHWIAAHKEFHKLRQDDLSTAALQRWQRLLQAAFLDEQDDE